MPKSGSNGFTYIELAVAMCIVALVLIATLLTPSLGVQTGLTGITILLSLRKAPAKE